MSYRALHTSVETSVWQSKRLSYRLRLSYRRLKPVWHNLTLSYSPLSYIYIQLPHIHTPPLILFEFFQVFCAKTCWLRVFKLYSLLVTIIFKEYSRYSVQILRNSNPFSVISWTIFTRFLLVCGRRSLLCSSPWIPNCSSKCLHLIGVSIFSRVLWRLRPRLATWVYLDLVDCCGIQIGHLQFN